MEITYFYAIILGLVAGSFVNAWVYRLNTNESVLFERSHCVNCGKTIRWRDLIPLVSFISLKGKCRDCQEPISIEYPLVELITAILYFAIVYFNRLTIVDFLSLTPVIYQMLMAVFLETIFIFDLKHYLIPENAIWGALTLTIIFKIFEFLLSSNISLSLALSIVSNHVLAIIFVGGFLWFLAFISKEKWMGWGDVQLGSLIGIILGYPNALIALFIAFLIGAIIGLIVVLLGKKTLKGMVPFAPFLVIGAVIAFYWGDNLSLWYQSVLGL